MPRAKRPLAAGVEGHGADYRLVDEKREGDRAGDATRAAASERLPRSALACRLDPGSSLLGEGGKAGSLAGVVLDLIRLGRGVVSEDRGSLPPFDHRGDANVQDPGFPGGVSLVTSSRAGEED